MITLLIHLMATWFLIGVITFVQVIHYPLLLQTDGRMPATFFKTHVRQTTYALAAPLAVEMVTAVLLVIYPSFRGLILPWIGLIFLVLIWGSTIFIQVPCHRKLTQGYDRKVAERLVRSNWIRTFGWWGRGFVAVLLILSAI